MNLSKCETELLMARDALRQCKSDLNDCQVKSYHNFITEDEKEECIPPPEGQRPWEIIAVDGVISYHDYATGIEISEAQYRKIMCLDPLVKEERKETSQQPASLCGGMDGSEVSFLGRSVCSISNVSDIKSCTHINADPVVIKCKLRNGNEVTVNPDTINRFIASKHPSEQCSGNTCEYIST